MYIKYMIDVHVGLRPNVDMAVLGTVGTYKSRIPRVCF